MKAQQKRFSLTSKNSGKGKRHQVITRCQQYQHPKVKNKSLSLHKFEYKKEYGHPLQNGQNWEFWGCTRPPKKPRKSQFVQRTTFIHSHQSSGEKILSEYLKRKERKNQKLVLVNDFSTLNPENQRAASVPIPRNRSVVVTRGRHREKTDKFYSTLNQRAHSRSLFETQSPELLMSSKRQQSKFNQPPSATEQKAKEFLSTSEQMTLVTHYDSILTDQNTSQAQSAKGKLRKSLQKKHNIVAMGSEHLRGYRKPQSSAFMEKMKELNQTILLRDTVLKKMGQSLYFIRQKKMNMHI